MATTGWRTGRTVKQLLLTQYSRFDNFQWLRLVQWPVAARRSPVVRFRADLSAGFAGHELSALHYTAPQPGQREEIRVDTPNYCIASLLGPLPEPFTEWVRDLKRARAPAMADFLDMFNHRLNLLRYQIKSRQTLALNNRPPEQTEHAAQLAAIMGMGLPQLAAQIALPQRSWLGLAGLLANCRRSAPALAQVLTVYVGARVRVTELVGAWHAIMPQQRMALGRRGHVLGHTSLLGCRTWDQAARIRLVVDPLDYARFCALLPPGDAQATGAGAGHAGLVSLLRLLLNGMHDCEVELRLAEPAAPPHLLSGAAVGAANIGLRLHHSAWLGKPASASAAAPAARTVRYLVPAYAAMEPA